MVLDHGVRLTCGPGERRGGYWCNTKGHSFFVRTDTIGSAPLELSPLSSCHCAPAPHVSSRHQIRGVATQTGKAQLSLLSGLCITCQTPRSQTKSKPLLSNFTSLHSRLRKGSQSSARGSRWRRTCPSSLASGPKDAHPRSCPPTRLCPCTCSTIRPPCGASRSCGPSSSTRCSMQTSWAIRSRSSSRWRAGESLAGGYGSG